MPAAKTEEEDPDYARLRIFLQQYLFLDAVVEIEEVDIPEPDLESYLAEDTEDEEKSEHRIYDGHLLWECDNYSVEVRPDAKEIKMGRDVFRVKVIHKPHLQVQNSGHLYDLHKVEDLCHFLKDDQFEEAMTLLFKTYGGGSRNRQERNSEDLESIVSESWVRTTISGLEP
jgi:hypothetical protein